jgi:hypothetical protein
MKAGVSVDVECEPDWDTDAEIGLLEIPPPPPAAGVSQTWGAKTSTRIPLIRVIGLADSEATGKLLKENEGNKSVRTVYTEKAGRPEESSGLTQSCRNRSVNLMALHPSRRRAVPPAQPNGAGSGHELDTHRVLGLPQ